MLEMVAKPEASISVDPLDWLEMQVAEYTAYLDEREDESREDG